MEKELLQIAKRMRKVHKKLLKEEITPEYAHAVIGLADTSIRAIMSAARIK